MGHQADTLPFDIGTYEGAGGATDKQEWEGREYEIEDLDYSSKVNAPRAYTASQGCTRRVRIVRNVSGIALLPGRAVIYKTGAGGIGYQVDGYTYTTAQRAAGIVDEFLPTAGVPNNYLFYIVVDGNVNVLTSLGGNAENVFSAGSHLVALTAATSQATTAGRVTVQDLTGATQLLAEQVQNMFGQALSASTTANTNASKLAKVRFW